MSQEQIFVVPRSKFSSFLDFKGFKTSEGISLKEWVDAGTYKPRAMMEEDPSYKQLIPYIILRNNQLVFRYWRTKRAGESRLHHLYSIGIGGHINPVDDNLFPDTSELLHEAALRELHEEIEVESNVDLHHIGFINDDDSEVGKVHLGIVFECWLPDQNVKLRESALGRGEWIEVNNLYDDVEYETWSDFLIKDYLSNNNE